MGIKGGGIVTQSDSPIQEMGSELVGLCLSVRGEIFTISNWINNLRGQSLQGQPGHLRPVIGILSANSCEAKMRVQSWLGRSAGRRA